MEAKFKRGDVVVENDINVPMLFIENNNYFFNIILNYTLWIK